MPTLSYSRSDKPQTKGSARERLAGSMKRPWKHEQGQEEDEEDPTDIFDTGLSTIFDIPPIGFTPSSNGYYTYHPPSQSRPSPIQLKLPQPPPSLYNTLQANLIWPSALYLADLLSRQIIEVKGKNVAELGSGAGLPGIIACRAGEARRVVSTDWGVEEVLSVLEGNFERACGNSQAGEAREEHKESVQSDRRWKVVGHEWGTDPSPLLTALGPSHCLASSSTSSSSREDPKTPESAEVEGTMRVHQEQDRKLNGELRFDTILLADVIWSTPAHTALLDSVSSLLAEDGIVHLTAGLHTGRGPLERFIDAAKSRGMKVDMVKEVRIGRGLTGDGAANEGGDRWTEYNESLSRPGEEERGVVVYLTLRL